MEALVPLLAGIQPWHWLVLGLVLLISEMMSGTSYLLWPAVAAFVTGLVAFSGMTNWVFDVTLFAVLTIALTLMGRPLVQRWRNAGGLTNLNERSRSLVGTRATLANFANGVGAVKINDTMWRAVSDDALNAGDNVEVAGVEGSTLKVKRA